MPEAIITAGISALQMMISCSIIIFQIPVGILTREAKLQDRLTSLPRYCMRWDINSVLRILMIRKTVIRSCMVILLMENDVFQQQVILRN